MCTCTRSIPIVGCPRLLFHCNRGYSQYVNGVSIRNLKTRHVVASGARLTWSENRMILLDRPMYRTAGVWLRERLNSKQCHLMLSAESLPCYPMLTKMCINSASNRGRRIGSHITPELQVLIKELASCHSSGT